MSASTYTNLLFDLDGTLVDTGPGIVNGVLYAAKELRLETLNLEKARLFVGPPLVESFRKNAHIGQEEAIEAARVFRVYYAEKGIFECEPYAEIPEVLKELRKRGYHLFVATSKPTVFAKAILERFGLAFDFDDIVGSNMDNTRGKKSEVIQYLLQRHSLAKEACLMIGDKSNDIVGAKAIGIDSLGVRYGYAEEGEIENAEPTFIVDSAKEILSVL